jgi:hypothetical protein
MPGVGLLMLVKDEEALLRKNLLYHRHLGVSRFYVFDDGSSDGTIASVADLPGVIIRAAASAQELADQGLAARLAPRTDDVNVRQMLSAALALDLARAEGLDWLVHVDADELVAPRLDRAEQGALARLLAAQPRGVDAVRFATLELVQRRLDNERPFEEEELFKRDARGLSREILDPRRDERITIKGFYGHSFGKSAVRPALRPRPESPHAFAGADDRPLRYAAAGYLLHYHFFSAWDFARKSRRTELSPLLYAGTHPVRPHRRLFRELADDPRFSDAELRSYFERWLLMSDDEVARLAAPRLGLFPGRARIVRVEAVSHAFARLDTGPEAER